MNSIGADQGLASLYLYLPHLYFLESIPTLILSNYRDTSPQLAVHHHRKGGGEGTGRKRKWEGGTRVYSVRLIRGGERERERTHG